MGKGQNVLFFTQFMSIFLNKAEQIEKQNFLREKEGVKKVCFTINLFGTEHRKDKRSQVDINHGDSSMLF